MVQIITDSSNLYTAEVEILKLSHAFITQGGPQCVAIQYIEK